MKSAHIRQAFLDFFAQHQHQTVASSTLVPANDPTLLFTNAGMVQFKDTFLGKEPRSYTRAASAQRVVRAGGKHNDLENVGYTARHHTFFEMLGNFSFGDYFKREAIQLAWAFLTDVLGLPADKLWVTVFHEDKEAEAIWLDEMKVDPERFSRLGEKDNFWSMGDTGPCGPCTEIFYDHGPAVAGGPPGSPEEDGDRYIEIWNLVFMQYDRQPNGECVPLPKPSVDTGMGLERISAVMQNVHNNYEIDLFAYLIDAVRATLKESRSQGDVGDAGEESVHSLRVIADHIRACSFLIVDGVVPSNEGRGYVLRRIIRRAIRHGNKLGATGSFFYRCVQPLADMMGEAYPELLRAQQHVEKVLKIEEEKFAETLEQGLKILEKDLSQLQGCEIPGLTIFTLYDTYGFPVDLTADIARERSLTLDMEGFDQAMTEQKQRSRQSDQFANHYHDGLKLGETTEFTGYDLNEDSSTVSYIHMAQGGVESASEGDKAIVVLRRTPFYAESGGQIGDAGLITTDSGTFKVNSTTKETETFLHHGEVVSGQLSVGQSVNAAINREDRSAIRLNHSATHLLHAALKEVLGDHVNQKGSLVDENRLRFDFSHLDAVSPQALRDIEALVNQQIRANTEVVTEVMSIESAKEKGAMALFGEKYGDTVRVLSMGGTFSIELCGGTHVKRTGDIGLFKIVSESGVAAGVRRIEAVTGLAACQYVEALEAELNALSAEVKAGREKLVKRVKQLVKDHRDAEKEVQRLQQKAAASKGADLANQAIDVGGIKLIVEIIEGADAKSIRTTIDQLKDKLRHAVIVIATTQQEKVQIAVGVTKVESASIKAGELVNYVAQQVGGKGGGRPDMAMAGGSQPENLKAAMQSVQPWVKKKLS